MQINTIKLWSLIAIVAVMGFIVSCQNEEDIDPQEELANQQNAEEDKPIEVSVIESGVQIEGATKVTGTPPQPTGNVDFQIDTKQQEGFQGSGFEIAFSSTSDVAGAYIQLKDTEGNPANSYFDVPATTFDGNTSTGRVEDSNRGRFGTGARTQEDDDKVIEVNFGNSVPAGEFCYDICLYDAANNVSQIQTICVTVEAWGGNASLVGDWDFDKVEITPEDPFGTSTISCENGQNIEVDFSQIVEESLTLSFGEDGTYRESYSESYRSLDYFATLSSCSAVYVDSLSQFSYNMVGNWAYNEEEKTMTVVAFQLEYPFSPEDNQTLEDGELWFEGFTVEIIEGQLVFTFSDTFFTYDPQSQQSVETTLTYKYYFNRKTSS